jgi:hypothetical protein
MSRHSGEARKHGFRSYIEVTIYKRSANIHLDINQHTHYYQRYIMEGVSELKNNQLGMKLPELNLQYHPC